MTLATGTIVNTRYRIVKLLGQGGFGAVYKAWDLNLNRACALKENLDTSPEAGRQFVREAQVLANLSHPNLPRVNDHFLVPGHGQYLVMELIEGEDLESMVQRQGVLPSQQALYWIEQIADAVQYLHSQQPPVIHRDIKPANIRITPEGRAMLVDFGLVKIYDPHLQTTIGARAVTPGYSPPEQYGQGTTDARADIYALAATLYALLTGQQPQESVQRIVADRVVAANMINRQVAATVGQAIQQAMALTPSQRYQTTADFKAALITLQSPAPRPIGPAPLMSPPAAAPYYAPRLQPPAPPAPRSSNRGVKMVLGLVMGMVLIITASLAVMQSQQMREVQANAIAQVNATATAQANVAVYANATATVRAAATEEAYSIAATAQANTAATAQTALAELRATATATARENSVGLMESGRKLVFGPRSGNLAHAASTKSVSDYAAGTELSDFEVEVTFFNPFPTSDGSWDYGFLFRWSGSAEQFRLVIFSDKSWILMNNAGSADGTVIDSGHYSDLDISDQGSNSIKLIGKGKQGWLYINGDFVAELDLSVRVNSGKISAATGIYAGHQIDGKTTRFADFTVWSIK